MSSTPGAAADPKKLRNLVRPVGDIETAVAFDIGRQRQHHAASRFDGIERRPQRFAVQDHGRLRIGALEVAKDPVVARPDADDRWPGRRLVRRPAVVPRRRHTAGQHRRGRDPARQCRPRARRPHHVHGKRPQHEQAEQMRLNRIGKRRDGDRQTGWRCRESPSRPVASRRASTRDRSPRATAAPVR